MGKNTFTAVGKFTCHSHRLVQAERFKRTDARKDTRVASYKRQLQTKSCEVTLKVPKLRKLLFETAIIEQYRRQESSVEEALVDVPGRCERMSCRRYYRDVVEHQSITEYGE